MVMKVTKDPVDVVDELGIEHPAIMTLAEAAKIQRDHTGDGISTLLVLVSALLTEADKLIDDGDANVKVGEQVIGGVGAGEIVGEMGLLDYRPRSATVVASSPMKVYVIDARRFESVLEETPTLARNLLRELTGRIRGLDQARADEAAA